jgi:hypothetical protein
MDQNSTFDSSLFKVLGDAGILGMSIKKEYGGSQLSPTEIGLLHEELGAGYISVENAVTVFGMLSQIFDRSGSETQKQKYLRSLASGDCIGAFALTEEENGSDFAFIKTSLTKDGTHYRLNGKKKWITLGEIADFFLVFTRFENKYAICIVEKNDPGFVRIPIKGTLGLRANMLAELSFDQCVLSEDRIICIGDLKPKMSVLGALTLARFTTACGAVGLSTACCNAVYDYARHRNCSNQIIGEFQLVKKMMTEMHASTQSAMHICRHAAKMMEKESHKSILPILTAKYVASKCAVEVSNHAVQIFAAKGTSAECPIERHYRDAKILEIIEGTSQIHEVMIGSELLKKKHENI